MARSMSLGMVFLLLLLSSVPLQAQWSPAFLPGAYLPQVGVSGEIDTIYGWNAQFGGFGDNLINIGPPIYGGYGSIAGRDFEEYPVNFRSFSTGPNFDLHNLNFDSRVNCPLALNEGLEIIFIGPIRTSRSHDIVLADHDGNKPPRIYWEGNDGRYDSASFTILATPRASAGNSSNYEIAPVFGHFVSDTVNDIFFESAAYHADFDSLFLNFIRGGSTLAAGPRLHLSDSIELARYFPHALHAAVVSFVVAGEFRASKHADLLRLTLADTGRGIVQNAIFIRNETPFSLKRIADEWDLDSILVERENPGLRIGSKFWAFSALDHSHDFCQDAVLRLVTEGQEEGLYIFRGGPDFGSHRITVDSAAFVLPHPRKFDGDWKFLQFIDIRIVGDISGKGVPMLCEQYAWGYQAYYFFYGLQRGISDHASAFWTVYSGGGTYDSVTADRDRIEDVIFGQTAFSNNGTAFDGKGAIFVMHGSPTIPVEGLDVAVSRPLQKQEIRIFPNPSNGVFSAIVNAPSEAQEVTLSVRDILGEQVYSQRLQMTPGLQSIPIRLPLPSGTYHISLDVANDRLSSLLVIAR
jgi:hypothetical protein